MNQVEKEAVENHNARPGADQATEAEQCGSIVIVRNASGSLAAYRVHDGHLKAVLAGLDPSTLTVQDLARIADTTEFPSAFLRLAVRKLGEELHGGEK